MQDIAIWPVWLEIGYSRPVWGSFWGLYLTTNYLLPRFQSAYRRFHSTETALLRVISDILKAADQQQVTLLGLLDLSAAFDCVDREILLARLQRGMGLDKSGAELATIVPS